MADGPFAALYAMLDRDSEFERDVLELVDEAASQLDKSRLDHAEATHLLGLLERNAGYHADCGEDCPANTAAEKLRALLTEPSTASTAEQHEDTQ